MTYDNELILISQAAPTRDEIGNAVPGELIETAVLCHEVSVSRSEFYQAAAAGLKPERVFRIHAIEYAGEQLVRFEGQLYRVMRTYATDSEEVELTCERGGSL